FCGNRIVSGSDDNTLKVWSAVTGECVQTLVGHTGGVWSSQMRDSIVISGSTDRTLKVWNADTGECVHTLYGHTKHQSAVTCLQFSSKFVVTSSDDGTVKLWDLKTGEFVRNLVALESGGSGGVVWRIRASNTKLVCAVGSRNGTEETKLLVLDFDVDLK
ncbi:FBXW7 protein, partial [Uria aalge]|nr:FBXW7 protein [Uria aalge]NXY79790.1 FBXW7 protein [Glareola pratincola]